MRKLSFLLLLYLSVCEFSNAQALEKSKPFSNPALIYGSDFLSIFQVYYKQGNWEMMMVLTSKASINQYGYDSICDYYKKMQFAYTIKIKSIKKDSTYTDMNYEASIMATNNIVRCRVLVENDTCRIALPKGFVSSKIFLHE